MDKQIKVYVCEDNKDFSKQLIKIIEKLGKMHVVGNQCQGDLCVNDPKILTCDVLLLDLEMPNKDGIWVIEQIAGKGPEILILTTFADENKVFEAIKKGAAGYLVKGINPKKLIQAIKDVAYGGTVIEPRLAARFWNLFMASIGKSSDPWGLTQEELEVLTMVGKGLSNPEIGATLGKSRSSIKRILESIYKKMGVHSRVKAVTKALNAGLIEL